MSGSMLLCEGVLALVCVAGTALVAARLLRVSGEVFAVSGANVRALAVDAENRGLAKAAQDIAKAVDQTTQAVEIGTSIVQTSHQAIAAIPFGVLDAIPVTRTTSRIVRGIHDETAAGVYRAIFGVNKAIGDAFRNPKEPDPE